MKTFQNPPESPAIGEFVYEGCRYAGIAPGLVFSILSEGLCDYLKEAFPQLIESGSVAPVADNEYCCSKCGKDCGSKFMKDRHEKVCQESSKGLATILKPSYIFWNYKNLDRTQITEGQLIPDSVNRIPPEQVRAMTEKEVTEPMPGVQREALIGKRMEQVTTDRDGIDWYGDGLQNDTP
jgi:hypothetical protein